MRSYRPKALALLVVEETVHVHRPRGRVVVKLTQSGEDHRIFIARVHVTSTLSGAAAAAQTRGKGCISGKAAVCMRHPNDNSVCQ